MEDQNKLQNKGYLFPNKNKSKSTQPDLTGKINWKGEEISISAWEKVNANGERFLSISLSEKFIKKDESQSNSVNNQSSAKPQPVINKKINQTSDHPDNDVSNFFNSDDKELDDLTNFFDSK